jgi:hypothetical protein
MTCFILRACFCREENHLSPCMPWAPSYWWEGVFSLEPIPISCFRVSYTQNFSAASGSRRRQASSWIGPKHSLFSKGGGVLSGLAVEGANHHDFKMAWETVESILVQQPESTPDTPQGLRLDKSNSCML